jgi:CRP-like cAMP-binding protein
MKEGELGKVYSDSEIIFREGEQGDRMFVVQSGRVKVIKETPAGEIVIAILGNGEIFGEMALFSKSPRSATVTALGDARILGIDKKKLFSTISMDPTLVFTLLESMSHRLRTINEEFAKLKKSRLDILHVYTDVDETCDLILEEARNIISAENGSVMLLDDEGKTLSIKAAFGSESEPKVKLSVGEGIAGDVIKTARAELINKVLLDSRFVKGSKHIESLLCVPLKYKERIFGVLNMSNSSEKLFTLDDLKLLHTLSITASMAVQNAMNYSHLKYATDEVIKRATMLGMW